jgi:hypothetical protein
VSPTFKLVFLTVVAITRSRHLGTDRPGCLLDNPDP